MKFRTIIAALTFAASIGNAAAAQPIKLVVAAPTGGGSDILLRTIATETARVLDNPVVVLNVPAAGGTVAIEQMLRAPADGKTVVGVANSTLTAAPHLFQVRYGQDDFVALLGVSEAPYVMCVAPSFPANNGKEFIEALRARPDEYTIGTDGGAGQLAAARVLRALNVKARNIPFKGAGETIVAFLGGHIDIYNGSVTTINPTMKSGKAKCLLLTSTERSQVARQAASLVDMGIPEQATPLWRILVVHKDTPPATLKYLQDAFEKAATSTAARKQMEDVGDRAVVIKGDELRQRLRGEYDALGKVAKELGMTP